VYRCPQGQSRRNRAPETAVAGSEKNAKHQNFFLKWIPNDRKDTLLCVKIHFYGSSTTTKGEPARKEIPRNRSDSVV
jgi:DNA primase